MSRSLRAVVFLLCVMSCSGCAWFTPSAIKQEAAMVRIDCGTAINEVKALPDGPAKDKALSTLNRIYPHLQNIENYLYGNKSQPASSEVK